MNDLLIWLSVGVAAAAAVASDPPGSLWDFSTKTLGGVPKDLSEYRGKVALVVNTASECGFTPQYAGLETLWQEYRERGFVVLGFPSNDFGEQEPGSAEEIGRFCKKNYGVTFPMFEKSQVRGEGRSPIYEFLAREHGEPRWNFHKVLVDREGKVIDAFPSQKTPESLRPEIEKALGD